MVIYVKKTRKQIKKYNKMQQNHLTKHRKYGKTKMNKK